MQKTYEKMLPEGYEPVCVIDAKSKKVSVRMTVFSLILTLAIIAVAALLLRPTGLREQFRPLSYFVFLAALFLYIVAHELVHGIAYKLLTHEKLTFGLTRSVAYCGVPDIYVYRKTALISLLAPFVVFTPVFLLPAILLSREWDKLYAAILLAIHIGGCVGDLYDTALLLTRLRDPGTLMNDTGPKQTFYQKKKEN